jgi:hypothetical protein
MLSKKYNSGKPRKLPTQVSNNTTGVVGVSYVKRTDRYRARFCIRGRSYHVGDFLTLAEASAELRIAKAEMGVAA